MVAKRKIIATAGNQSPVIQPVASSLYHMRVLSVHIKKNSTLLWTDI
jgi:hypothetical protein